jgi:hypothetical protein
MKLEIHQITPTAWQFWPGAGGRQNINGPEMSYKEEM